jgi:hypothetical protein
MEILDEMEKRGEFNGLTKEEKKNERMVVGMMIRSNIHCPSLDQKEGS